MYSTLFRGEDLSVDYRAQCPILTFTTLHIMSNSSKAQFIKDFLSRAQAKSPREQITQEIHLK